MRKRGNVLCCALAHVPASKINRSATHVFCLYGKRSDLHGNLRQYGYGAAQLVPKFAHGSASALVESLLGEGGAGGGSAGHLRSAGGGLAHPTSDNQPPSPQPQPLPQPLQPQPRQPLPSLRRLEDCPAVPALAN